MSVDLKQPNLNADHYKDHKNGPRSFQNYSFINVHSDGSTLVGATDMIGRYWDGLLQISSSPVEFLLSDSKSTSKIMIENSPSIGSFLSDSSKMVICDDFGDFHLWAKQRAWGDINSTNKEQESWCIVAARTEHDDAILGLGLFHGEDVAVTGGADNCIKIWDLQQIVSLETYRPAHTHIITDIACSPHRKHIFLSSSLDGSVALWNFQGGEKRAQVYQVANCGVRCVCWLSENTFVVGCDNGDISMYDCRNGKEQLNYSVKHLTAVHNLEYNAGSNCLAACYDSNIINIYKQKDATDFELVYQDASHTQYVRGLAWDKSNTGVMYSCGWDEKVLCHRVM